MSLFGDYAGPEFGLRDVKIAGWNVGDTYDAAVDVPSVQMYGVNPQTVNANLEGDDRITDSHSIVTMAQVRIRFGSISLEALEVLIGQTVNESSSTPTRVKTLKILGSMKFPYFGILGKALATQDAGATHIWVPKVKIMEGFEVGMQYGQYVIPELTCQAVAPSDGGTIAEFLKYETDIDLVIPPVGA
jgi:hypothetical protein